MAQELQRRNGDGDPAGNCRRRYLAVCQRRSQRLRVADGYPNAVDLAVRELSERRLELSPSLATGNVREFGESLATSPERRNGCAPSAQSVLLVAMFERMASDGDSLTMLTSRVPESLVRDLDRIARRDQTSRSELVRQALSRRIAESDGDRKRTRRKSP